MKTRPTISRRAGRAVPLLVLCGLTAGCGPTITVPDVVGMRLDVAHQKFEALGVENFNDTDVVGGEDAIFWDANWVVVEQDPVPGTAEVDTDTTIELSVGHEDDGEVLDLIPSDSAFALEVVEEAAERQAEEQAEAEQAKREDDEQTDAEEPVTGDEDANADAELAASCASRKGNPGEIYVWNSYGSEQPPDATRLGAGYVWDFGDKECITTTEFALSTGPPLDGFCTEVGKVSANPGYRVNARPARRIPNIIGQAGDC